MSSQYADPCERLEACLAEIGAVNPTFRTTAEKQQALVALSRARARLAAEEMRILATADDVAEATGARSTAAWLAQTTKDSPGRLRADKKLADALDTRWTKLQAAFRKGRVNLAQVRVIDKALADLPQDLDAGLVAKAEEILVAEARDHGPKELGILGARILEKLAPEVAEQAEYAALLAAEDRASAATRLTLRRRGDGSTDLFARIPDAAAARLRTYLDAYTAPRRNHRHNHRHKSSADPHRDEFAQLPAERRQGIGFVALLESVLTSDLPRHGGKATTMAVLIPHHQLLADLHTAGVVTTTSGEPMTAGQARRLACTAGLLPAVLGSRSEILDLGRESRLFTTAQRKALEIRYPTCTETDCTMPAAFTEAHHKTPWAHGGQTNLDDGTLLCSFHHHRAHHPHWHATYHPNGSTTFHRRQ